MIILCVDHIDFIGKLYNKEANKEANQRPDSPRQVEFEPAPDLEDENATKESEPPQSGMG